MRWLPAGSESEKIWISNFLAEERGQNNVYKVFVTTTDILSTELWLTNDNICLPRGVSVYLPVGTICLSIEPGSTGTYFQFPAYRSLKT